jgi:hypothetical protein
MAIFGDDEPFIPVNYLSLIADSFRHYEGFAVSKSKVMEDAVADVKIILENAIRRGEIRGDIDVTIVALQYFSMSIGLAGDLIRNNSVKSAMESMTSQLNQLYYLLKK